MNKNLNISSSNFFKLKWILVILILSGAVSAIILVRESKGMLRQRLSTIPLMGKLIHERNQTYLRAKLVELDSKHPRIDNLIKFIFNSDRSTPMYLADYLKYYQLVADYFPETSDAYGMLGYCYYYLGELEKSKQAFLKARELNKNYFWYLYDLIIVEIKLNNLIDAKDHLQEAALFGQVDFEKTLAFMPQSQIFQEIFQRVDGISMEYLRKNLISGFMTLEELNQDRLKWESLVNQKADLDLKLF